MINRSILAAIVALGSLSAAHAERNPQDDLPLLSVTTAGDWRASSGQCNFMPPPTMADGDQLVFHPVIDVHVHLDEKGTPHIALWNGGPLGGHKLNLQPGALVIVASEVTPEILAAMHDGQTLRIEYQDGSSDAPFIRERPLKGLGGLVDACRALERRYDEQEARAMPDTKADITLLCDGQTVQVWFNAGLVTWDTAAHRHVWRLDPVGAAEITFKRLGRYGTDAMPGFMRDGPSFADLNGQIDRVSGAFSLTDGSHGACAPAAVKF